jgi:hypothetical protein
MQPSGILRRVAPVRIDFSKERSASIIRVTRIGELGTTLATEALRRNTSISNNTSSITTNINKLAVIVTSVSLTFQRDSLASYC